MPAQISATPPTSNKRSFALLCGWIGVAVVGLWWGRQTPAPPQEHAEEVQVAERKAGWIKRDVEAWRVAHGDHRVPWAEAEGHLAIVIDDVGRELDAHAQLQSLRHPLTFSVLPGSDYAAGAQLRLREDPRRYREIWLHLPMEPELASQMHGGDEVQEDFLKLSDSAAERAEKFAVAMRQVPSAIGVNNHMGSRLTTDPQAMDELAALLAGRGLLFLDSRTTAQTVAADAARRAGVPSAQRRVFLDHDPDPQAMRAALREAIELSKSEPVIAIGHPSAALAAVLEAGLEDARTQRIGIYPLSEVIAHIAPRPQRAAAQLPQRAP